MGNSSSTSIQTCLQGVCGSRQNCVSFPSNPLYYVEWARPYSLDYPVTPIAVVRPDNTQDVSDFVKCAAKNGVKVQARSGGHSYGNHGLGGVSGALSIDLRNLQAFSLDPTNFQARIGGGSRLGEIDKRLANASAALGVPTRAFAHGTCPGVGIGGHATVGGIGPSSRMWGTTLDHVVEVEVVTADDGRVVRANANGDNSDLFFAVRGAGSGFGIVTEFVMQTHPPPSLAVQSTYDINLAAGGVSVTEMYAAWQNLAMMPGLDRRFASEFVRHAGGAVTTITFYGSPEEFEATGIPVKIPFGAMPGVRTGRIVLDNWLGMVAASAQASALGLTDVPIPFRSKSVGLSSSQLPDRNGVDSFFKWVDNVVDKGTPLWFLVWSVAGGAINDVPANATAFGLRDKLIYYDSYGVGIGARRDEFIDGAHKKMLEVTNIHANGYETYAGYIDPALSSERAQIAYWGRNLDRLRMIKRKWDISNIFSNPQSPYVD